jgi:mono/diheme cytochrome c family protein
MTISRTAILAILVAVTLPAQDGDAERGKKIYTKTGCWQCHGREGQGGGYVGPRLAPDPMPFNVLEAYIRHPSGDMPPYSKKVLPDAAVRDIYAFLKSVPKPPPAAKIDALNH